MKLTKISATNFKGSPFFTINLTPATVLVGGNFRGKTRVTDAIRLALLGYLPELGKNNKETMSLASGPTMEVVAEFQDGTKIRRSWSLKGNSVTKDEDVPEAVKAWGDLNVMLNADEYFALTDRKRMEYVFAHCPGASQLKPEDILSRAELKVSQEIPDYVEAEYDKTTKSIYDEAVAGGFMAPADFIECALNRYTHVYKDAKANAVRAEKMIQQMTDMRLRDTPTTPVAVLEQKRKALVVEIAALNEKKGANLGRFTQMKSDASRREVIRRETSFGDKNRQALVDLKAKLELVCAQLKAEDEVTPTMANAAESAVNQVNLKVRDATRLRSEAATRKNAAVVQLGDLDGKMECPYCGATGDGWKALKAAELATAIDKEEQIGVDQAKVLIDLKVDLAAAEGQRDELVAMQNKQQGLMAEMDAITAKIRAIEPQIARLDALAEELARLSVDDPALTASVETIQSELNVKNDDLRVVDMEITAVNGRTFELQRLANAEKERDDAKVEASIAEAAGKELRVIQGEMVVAAFKPLLERANRFFSQVLASPLAYNAKEGGEIGTWRDGLWVGHRTFSGTEKALAYAAIQAALAMSSPFKLMLIDELGRLDGRSVDRLIRSVGAAVDGGVIDGFVGIDTGRMPFYAERALENPDLQVIEIK